MKYLKTLAFPPYPSCFRKMLSLAGMVLLFTHVTRGEEPEYLMWKSKAGTQMEAKLVSCEAGNVVLEKRDGKRIQLKLTQLAEDDQARAQSSSTPPPADPPTAPAAAPATGETSIPGLDAKPGKCSAQIACGDASQWTYQLYLPSGFHTGRKWPVCFLMSPGGGSSGTIKQYTLAAEHLEMILAVSRQSKNDFPDSDLAMMAMLKDVYKRVPVMKDMAIASGMSGGSRMAYMMAELDDNVNGVVACGSGSGVYVKENPKSFHTAKLRKGTVVCSLLGTNDYNRREAVKSHLAHGKEARFIWFDGRHNWASPELLVEGVAHVYGTLLMKAKGLEVVPLRESFAARQLAWAKARQETHPGNTCHWAQFLSAIPGASQSEAKKLAADLAAKPEVQKELKAAKELDEFAEKFLGDGNTSGDMTANPAAQKAAEKQAAAFAGLPQEILFKKLGEPASK